MKIKKIFFFFILSWTKISILSCLQPLVVSPNFIKEEGEVSSVIEYIHFNTNHFFNENGKQVKAHNRLNRNEVAAYVECAVTDCDTLAIYGNMFHNEEEVHAEVKDIGNMELAWKRFICSEGSYEFAAQGILVIPIGERETAVRYGRLGVELDFHGKREFNVLERCGWIEALVGYRYYRGFPSDQVRANIVIGYDLFTHLRLIAAGYLDYGVYNGYAEFIGPILLMPPQFRLFTTKFYAVVPLVDFGSAFIGCYQNVWGENVGAGCGLFGGVWIDF